MSNKKHKFTLKGVQHLKVKKELLMDVKIDEDVVKDHPVGWVVVRGTEDPIYLKRLAPIVMEYNAVTDRLQKETEEHHKKEDKKEGEAEKFLDKLIKDSQEQLKKLHIGAVVCSIEDWDEEFFGESYSPAAASEVFSDDSNNAIYNQIDSFIKERDDFLPSASNQQ